MSHSAPVHTSARAHADAGTPVFEDVQTPAEGAQRANRVIGDIIARAKGLSPAQVEDVLQYQRQHGVRFGDASVALNLATHDDVLWALAQQFHYPYAPRHSGSFDNELLVASNPFSDEAEIFRDMRSLLLGEAGFGSRLGKCLAVSSPAVGDGKSFFAANLAIAFSQLGGRTLLLDADMRTPRLHQLFRLSETEGLSAMLSGRPGGAIHGITSLPSLHVLPVGVVPPNPLELVQAPAFSLLLADLQTRFDHILVDTPAAQHGADARVIASKCGAALLLGRRGTTRYEALGQLAKSIQRTRAEVVGMVMNEY